MESFSLMRKLEKVVELGVLYARLCRGLCWSSVLFGLGADSPVPIIDRQRVNP
jgi:hypothetical protein